MAKRTIFLLPALVVLTVAGCAGSGTSSDEASAGSVADTAEAAAGAVAVDTALIAEGRRSYRKYCVQCHGYTGKGDGTSAAHLDPPPRDHTNVEVMETINDRIIGETIRFGGVDRGFPGMPAFPKIPTREVVSLVAYVRSLSRPTVAEIHIGNLR